MAQVILLEGAAPSTPASNTITIYAKVDGKLYYKDDLGNEYGPLDAAGTGTVTSVALAVPTGFTVAGSPITSNGTLTISTTLSGLLKGDGANTISAAIAGTDYLAPAAIGVTVQAYDADTAKTDVAQNFTAPQRAAPTTDNDLSFALSAGNNFTCTPTGAGTLTFTDIATTAGQSGFIKLVNTNDYAISAHADTIISTADLATISASGTYLLSYFCDGTDVFVVASQDLTL